MAILFVSTSASLTPNVRADGCNLPGKSHDDNNPSSHKFKQMAYSASLCDLAKCVDTEECTNHTKVDWNKFKHSPAYTEASDEQQEEMDEYAKPGNGMDGFGGYEILHVVEETNN